MAQEQNEQQLDDLGLRVGRVAAPLREQVLEILRQAILDFRYRPGQRLIERELIEQIGVSRTTIREVLRELEAQGLVTTIPQKGAIVVIPSPEEAAEVYEVRAALETLAVRSFVERASDEQVAALRRACDEFAQLVADDQCTRLLMRGKDSFYAALLEGTGNTVVRATLDGLQARVRMLRATSLGTPGRAARVAEELDELVVAIERRDVDAAVLACERHLCGAERIGLVGLSPPLAPVA